MRIDQVVQQERALVRRDGNQVRMLWRMQSPQMAPLSTATQPP
jgi:general secretion pathway protein K